jgi:hypothetical protein
VEISRRWGAILLGAALLIGPAATSVAADLTPDQVTSRLASMHPDYPRYIHEIRYGRSRLRPVFLYAGLVRRGGDDPGDSAVGPLAGRGALNDLIVYADTFEPWRTEAWRLMVIDHEYFHARHLARGYNLPLVGFGRPQVDSDYLEAMAWAHVLGQVASGAYGDLSPAEKAEAVSRYRDHYDRFRRFVMGAQPSAWAHYGRFLPEPSSGITSARSALREEISPGAAAAIR